MPQDLTDDMSTLVQVMAWCHQATSHYLGNVDSVPCRLTASLGHNELICCGLVIRSCGVIWYIYPRPSGLLHWHWGNRIIDRYFISCLIALSWKVQHLSYAKSTLDQVMVMARCCGVLTLNMLIMLNCFRDFWRYIHILNCIWYLVWPKPMKLTLEQYMFSVIHSTMPADALMTLGARVSAGTVTARKA